MATFAKSSFNVSVYAASRPTYPPKLFDHILEYHRQGTGASDSPVNTTHPGFERAVDLGCGTGQATAQLRGRFEHVACVDPSAGMLEKAKAFLLADAPVTLNGHGPAEHRAGGQGINRHKQNASPPQITCTRFSFHQGSAEDLRQIIPDSGSVDLLIAAQACHWFDWTKVWPETERVLRRGGTAAFWVYGEFRLSAFPGLTPLITEYAQGTDRNSSTSVGSYFQRPGRTILERLLVDVPSPERIMGEECRLKDFHRDYFTDFGLGPEPQPTETSAIHPVLMRASWTWLDLLGYLRTWSALHSYHERFPEDLAREEDIRFLEGDLEDIRSSKLDEKSVRGGDISIRFWKNLREGAEKALLSSHNLTPGNGTDKGIGLLDKVTLEWPVAVLLTRKV